MLRSDTFSFISDWYHSGIVELTCLGDFKEDLAWIAEMLEITKLEAALALERLVTVGMLVRNFDGKLEKPKLFWAYRLVEQSGHPSIF